MGDVTAELRDHIVTVTLDRPPVNAVTTDTLAELRDVFSVLGDDRDVRVAILTAAGTKAFMAGVDLKTVGDRGPLDELPPALVLDRGHVARDAMWSIVDCPVPVIGAINGPALGAGLAIAACCDILVAAEGARFGTTEINVGLLGASAHLSLLVGRYKGARCSSRASRCPPRSSSGWGPSGPLSRPRSSPVRHVRSRWSWRRRARSHSAWPRSR